MWDYRKKTIPVKKEIQNWFNSESFQDSKLLSDVSDKIKSVNFERFYKFNTGLYCQIWYVWENFFVKIILKPKNCKWVKNSKN